MNAAAAGVESRLNQAAADGREGERAREFLLQAAGTPPASDRAGGRGTDGRLYMFPSFLPSLFCQIGVQLLTWGGKRGGWRWRIHAPNEFACD